MKKTLLKLLVLAFLTVIIIDACKKKEEVKPSPPAVKGCMDSTATNYNPNATVSDTCIYDTSQNTWEKVYPIFQTRCTFSVCHDNTPPVGLPDLQGTGPTLADSMQAVYDNIVNQIPSNDSARSKGYKLIYPGDYCRSFLFRKINNGFVADISLDVGEGCPMPKTLTIPCSTPPFPVDTNDLKLIRQWILLGALN
ncbi:MAG: hypothetical protein FVQ77_17165 [Cytophagales bacterium]|nr:hypothetical protein [Cytophagales bacterium]